MNFLQFTVFVYTQLWQNPQDKEPVNELTENLHKFCLSNSVESCGRANCVDVSWNMLIAIVDNYPTEIELLLAICKFLGVFLMNSFIFPVKNRLEIVK